VTSRTNKGPEAGDGQQRRGLLEALSDDTLAAVVDVLLRGRATQPDLASKTGLDKSAVSRALRHLRALGVVRSARGRGAKHAIVARAEIFEVLKAGDRLARAVNEAGDAAQREDARRTLRDELRGEAAEDDADTGS
jgi:transcription initiation factor IIE alpha subunit